MTIIEQIKAAKAATVELGTLNRMQKDRALIAMANSLDNNRGAIIDANRMDLKNAEDSGLPQAMYKRLVVDNAKIDEMVRGVMSVVALPDPVGEVMDVTELDDDLTLYQIRCPIGMLGVVFESRPDVVPQVMSLCLKSGNCVAFKGGSEAANTIGALFRILSEAAESAGTPKGAFVLLESREDVSAILALDEYIDLLIPRGSNSFVRYIQDNTRIPVLGHSSGICTIYVDKEFDEAKALEVIVDSKIQYPAACNAVENIIFDRGTNPAFVFKVIAALRSKNVEVRGDKRIRAIVPDAIPAKESKWDGTLKVDGVIVDPDTHHTAAIRRAVADVVPEGQSDWDEEYNDLIVSVGMVDDLDDAIAFINRHGSHHTDAIITTNKANAAKFAAKVDSADVFVNASTRFADGFRFGKGAEVGISTNRIHARGPVGMEGLMIYKYVLIGDGQVVKDYVGKSARPFKHTHPDKEYPLR